MTCRIEAIPMTLSHLQGHSLLQTFRCDSCPCDAMLAWYLLSLRVHLSVYLSVQFGVVPKRLQFRSCWQRSTIAQWLCIFMML